MIFFMSSFKAVRELNGFGQKAPALTPEESSKRSPAVAIIATVDDDRDVWFLFVDLSRFEDFGHDVVTETVVTALTSFVEDAGHR